jgi:starch synthase
MSPAATRDAARTAKMHTGLTAVDGSVVHLTAEYWPFARTGGLAEAVRGLAGHQKQLGQSTTVVMPLYAAVRDVTDAMVPATDPFTVTVGHREERARAWRYTASGTGPAVYFIEHEEYFGRDGLYGELGTDYPDNPRRFACFCRAALQVLPRLVPDARIVHAHDWHTALSIPYLRHLHGGDPFYDALGTVLSVHNAAYQGYFAADTMLAIGLPLSLYDWRYFEWYGHVNILKGGLAFADMAITVSPTHAMELRTPDGGFGLHDHFIAMDDRFTGILNGIDYALWDPGADPYLTAGFSISDLSPKRRNKASLQRAYNLPRRSRTPLFVMSARMVEQKGFDLILEPGLLTQFDAQFIFLGRGDPRYEAALSDLARLAPERVAVPLDFNERLEHRLLAGADGLLMPSQFEPCGLTQMRSQRYGAVPVARRVGGLTDTVVDGATGFLFDEYRPAGLERAMRRAIQAYHRRSHWSSLVTEGMRQDFSWGPSAARYQQAYHRAAAARNRR